MLGMVEVCGGKRALSKAVQRRLCQSPGSGTNCSRTFDLIRSTKDMEMTYIIIYVLGIYVERIGGCDVGRAGKPWMSEDRGNARLQQRVAITPNDLSSLQ